MVVVLLVVVFAIIGVVAVVVELWMLVRDWYIVGETVISTNFPLKRNLLTHARPACDRRYGANWVPPLAAVSSKPVLFILREGTRPAR